MTEPIDLSIASLVRMQARGFLPEEIEVEAEGHVEIVQQPENGSTFIVSCGSTSGKLRHHRQREIVSIAAFVAYKITIAAEDYRRAIGQIREGPGDGGRGSVANQGQDRAD